MGLILKQSVSKKIYDCYIIGEDNIFLNFFFLNITSQYLFQAQCFHLFENQSKCFQNMALEILVTFQRDEDFL